jgi:cytochrome P450
MARRSEAKEIGGCPVSHTDYRIERPAFENYRLLNDERERARFHWNDSTDHGFWMLTRYDDVVEALQMHDVFTNDQINAFFDDLSIALMPQNLNQPQHSKLRRILNPYFSPAAVKRLDDLSRERARTLVAELAPRKQTDLVEDFAILYPTELFLALFGLPTEDGAMLLPWVEAVFGGFFGAGEASAEEAAQAAKSLDAYFTAAIELRRREPLDPATDLITRLLEARLDGEPIPDRDILTICTSNLLAGLDTTRSALGYIFHHLATNPADRERLLADSSLWPRFIEESIRLYSLIIEDGRQAVVDVDHHGLPIKKGDMVWLGIASANRDPQKFPDPDTFDMDRDNLNHHLGFGAGPHRCIGMHLARRELVIALEEWHARIPEYHIAEGAVLRERGGQLRLQSLPLVWD